MSSSVYEEWQTSAIKVGGVWWGGGRVKGDMEKIIREEEQGENANSECTSTANTRILRICWYFVFTRLSILGRVFIIPPHFLSSMEDSVVMTIILFPRASSHPQQSLWALSASYVLSFLKQRS